MNESMTSVAFQASSTPAGLCAQLGLTSFTRGLTWPQGNQPASSVMAMARTGLDGHCPLGLTVELGDKTHDSGKGRGLLFTCGLCGADSKSYRTLSVGAGHGQPHWEGTSWKGQEYGRDTGVWDEWRERQSPFLTDRLLGQRLKWAGGWGTGLPVLRSRLRCSFLGKPTPTERPQLDSAVTQPESGSFPAGEKRSQFVIISVR